MAPDLPFLVFYTSGWMIWTGYMPTWLELQLILPLNSSEHTAMEYAHLTWLHHWWGKLIWFATSGSLLLCEGEKHLGKVSMWAETDDLRNVVLISWLLFNSLSVSSIISFTSQQDSYQASTSLLLSRHMGLWTTLLGSAPSGKIFASAQNNNQQSDIPQISEHREYYQCLHEGRCAVVHVC